jgi:pilus assembly protein TadC
VIDELNKNIETEINMLREISSYFKRAESAQPDEKKLLEGAIVSLINGMKIINGSIPDILSDISVATKLSPKKKNGLEKIEFKGMTGVEVVLNSKDKQTFLRELNISESFVKKLKKREIEEKEKYEEFKASRGYLKLANLLFLSSATDAAKKGGFKGLKANLSKANLDILFEAYIAMIYLSVLVASAVSSIVFIFLIFFNTVPVWPFFEFRDGEYLLRAAKLLWIPLAIPALTFLAVYFYPTTEKKSIGGRIDQELPFAVIHMSAVSGSGIEPSEIFRIIGLSREYPFLRKEIRKVMNQINLYGYDLTTALNNASRTAPSDKLAELFSGLATSISSGTNLSEFFEKRAETLLLSYRLEREKYTKVVETFLDIYISIVIAAPMVFLLLIVMMAISGVGLGLTPFQISLLAVGIIAVLNVIFLIFLQLKQPAY